MADGTAYLRNILYAAAVLDGPVYLALFTSSSDLNEVADAGYARQSITFDAAPVDGLGANTVRASFGPMVGSGTLTHAALFDAVTGGNRLTALVPLAGVDLTWEANVIFQVPIGDLQVQVS